MSYSTAQPFDPTQWREVEGFDFTDITYHRHVGDTRADGTVRIAFDRPEVRNAFRPHTVDELYQALDHARRDPSVGVVLLTGIVRIKRWTSRMCRRPPSAFTRASSTVSAVSPPAYW